MELQIIIFPYIIVQGMPAESMTALFTKRRKRARFPRKALEKEQEESKTGDHSASNDNTLPSNEQEILGTLEVSWKS